MTELADFEALSFDCYGTLIDWEAGITAALAPWVARNAISLDVGALLERYAIAEKREELESPAAPYPDILAAALRNLGADLGAPVSVDDSTLLARSVPDWPAFPDSAAALARLATRYKLIILSNVDRDSFARQQRSSGRSLRRDCHGTGCRLIQTVAAQLRGAACRGR